ncbi:izumo sperm-egg fusion protein 1 isoform X2 [Nelusetta ayraudi]|uniref:izumo sperm-egg fusion protein 1 isoform X2 n=1 Tax=Nelusetta ayraudi TaxID=303726 RepID=UPI003F70620F
MLILAFLLASLPLFRACLQCDTRIRTLHDNLILSAPSVSDQIVLKHICDQSYVEYKQASQQRKGVIDPTTLYRARTEYESEFNYFWKNEPRGTLTINTIQIMYKGREILEKHLDKFILDGLCPNKCGFLKRRVMDCASCRYKTYTCPTVQLDCGEHSLQAEEGGQAVLDCFFPWHRLLLGEPEYHYSWAPGDPRAVQLNEDDFKVLVVTEESSVVLNQLELNEQGTYRCTLQDRDGTVFFKATFLLTGAETNLLEAEKHCTHIL